MNVVPAAKREQTLCLLNAQSRDSVVKRYLGTVPFAKTIKETYDTQDKYPQNTCLLIEDESKMFTVWKSAEIVDHLLAVGRRCYAEFRTKCRHKELA